MPKIIAGLREKMLAQTGKILAASGYHEVTIRDVAKGCGVAVGTVYNYFPSKEMLIASVMLEDWIAALAQMRGAAAEASELGEGLRTMYEALCGFCGKYRSAWQQYSASGGDMAPLVKRHGQLVNQLAEPIQEMLKRLGKRPDPACVELTAEALLTRAQHQADLAPMVPALIKLLK